VNSFSEGKVVFHVRDGGQDDDFPEAVVGGLAGELHPEVQWIWSHSKGPGIAASDRVWVTWDSVRIGVARWGEPWQIVFHGSEAGYLQQTSATAFHDFVTWESGDGSYLGLMAWTPERGAYPFLTYPGDPSRGASGLGTDGLDMVWTYGEGKGPELEPYPAGSVMAAAFTTDPTLLEPRRLRSQPSPHYGPVSPWQVGCGHAAVEWAVDEVLVVRLSDGWSWALTTPNPEAPPAAQWHFGTVYAITCEEVFLRAGSPPAMNIAGVRLDALGPGTPPD
jgi:hypothetical protein